MISKENYSLQITISKKLLEKVKTHLNHELSVTNYIVNLIKNDLDKSANKSKEEN